MEFKPLDRKEQIDEISATNGLNVIFKHNTTCSISKRVRAEFELEAHKIPGVSCVYFLDLLEHRDISDTIARQFGVPHESPQLLVIRDGQCIYNESLYDISAAETAASIA